MFLNLTSVQVKKRFRLKNEKTDKTKHSFRNDVLQSKEGEEEVKYKVSNRDGTSSSLSGRAMFY